jgi:hypothetical protein
MRPALQPPSRVLPRAGAPLAIVAGTALSYAIAMPLGVPLLVPVLNTLPAFPFMIASLRRGHTGEAIARMLVWAAALGVCATAISYWRSEEAGRLFVHGEAYRTEMFSYVITGVGAEGNIRQFLPQHAFHAAVFTALALATGSLVAMPMGAMLMNYMAYYVGALAATSTRPLQVVAFAWVPWALVRIASFVTLGVVLAGPVLGRLFGFSCRLRDERRWIALALAGLALDVAMKWGLARAWLGLIRGSVW